MTRLDFERVHHEAGDECGYAPRAACLQIVTAGTLIRWVGEQRYELSAGQAMFVPAHVERRDQASRDAESVVVAIPRRMALSGIVVDRTTRAWAWNLARVVMVSMPAGAHDAERLAREGLAHLDRIHRLARLRPAWLDDAVRLARQSRSLTAIAATLGKHRCHVAREFRRHEGVTAGEYARRRRLEVASYRLRTTEETIVSVALSLGFCDQAHFTNAFHRLFEVTPAQFRRITRRQRATFAP